MTYLGSTQWTAQLLQIYNKGTVPKVLHKTSDIRSAKRHAAMMGTDLKNFVGTPRKELRSTTKAKRLTFANVNMRTNWELVLFTERKKFSFK